MIGLGAGKLCAAIGLRRVEQVVGDRHEAHLRGDSHVILEVVMEHLEALALFLRQARLVHEDKAANRASLLIVRLGLPLDCTLEHGFDFLARAAARALVVERNERWSGLVKVGLRVLAARVLGDDCDGERLGRAGRANDHQRHLCEAADDDHEQILLEALGLRDARLEARLLHQRSHRFLERTFDVRILLAALSLEPRAETSAVIFIKVARIGPEAHKIADRKGEEHGAVAALLQRLDARKKDGLHLPTTAVQEREELEYPEYVTQRNGRACPRVQLLLGDGTATLLHAVLNMFAREVSRLLLRGVHEVDERLHLIIQQALFRLQEAKTLGDELELLIGLQRAIVPHHLLHRRGQWVNLEVADGPLVALLVTAVRVDFDLGARGVACSDNDNVRRQQLTIEAVVDEEFLEDAHAARGVELVKEEAEGRLAVQLRVE